MIWFLKLEHTKENITVALKASHMKTSEGFLREQPKMKHLRRPESP